MAEYQADGAFDAPRGVSAQKIVHWLGAAASVALVAGVGYWGYKMVMRDVSGVPVVKAMEGELRVAPDDPGGEPAAHQGLAVNAIAAEGVAEKPADTLRLAPKPITLRAEDVPTGAIPSDATRAAVAEPAGPSPDAERMASIQALADRLAQGEAPLASPDTATPSGATPQDSALLAPVEAVMPPADLPDVITAQERPEPENAVEAALAQALAEGATEAEDGEEIAALKAQGALDVSVRPRLRPAALASGPVAVAPAAEAQVTPVAAGLDVDPATVPTGTRLAQLGAFESAEIARQEWDRLNSRFGDFLTGKQRVIQRAQSGGRTFYRLRAMGFADLADARRFCAAFVAEKSDCIPVVTK